MCRGFDQFLCLFITPPVPRDHHHLGLYCGEECSNKEQRGVHIQQHCEGRPKWQFVCIFCGLEFKKEYQLKVHKGRWCKAKP